MRSGSTLLLVQMLASSRMLYRGVFLAARCGRAGGFAVPQARNLAAGAKKAPKKASNGAPKATWKEKSCLGSRKGKTLVVHQASSIDDSSLSRDEGRLANDGATPIQLDAEMSDSFMKYAMSTILGRALPDVRDGLKPVHRRILYAMRELGLQPNQPYRKCARVVGEVLGKFHPHGDSSVYEAMVRMAQDFVMSRQLVDGHGNFGSVDADPPAAMRYTECRLTSFCYEALLNPADLGKVSANAEGDAQGLVDGISVAFAANFDGREFEPVVLPARVPVLLVNGASGIAVGMATNIPPHNLGEVVDATVLVVEALLRQLQTQSPDLDLSDEALVAALPAPDFPTGGTIMGTEGTRKLYATGQGSIKVRAKTHLERTTGTTKGRTCIVATELPYMVTKADLVKATADLVNAKKIEGIADLRDESGRDGIRVVYELKKDANPDVVLNVLFKTTRLESSFPANVVAIDSPSEREAADGRALAAAGDARSPQRMTIKYLLRRWVAFRFSCIRKRAERAERKAAARRHVLVGLRVAVTNVDEVVALIRASSSPAEAKEALCAATFAPGAVSSSSLAAGGGGEEPPLPVVFTLDELQAEAILKLQLSRLTSLEVNKVETELAQLDAELADIRALLTTDSVVYETMRAELLEIRKQHAGPRRTAIDSQDNGDFAMEDVIENARSAVLVSRASYVKRTPLLEFVAQGRGTKGSRIMPKQSVTSLLLQQVAPPPREEAADEDEDEDEEAPDGSSSPSPSTGGGLKKSKTNSAIEHFVSCYDHDTLLCIADDGIAYGVRAFEIPTASRIQRGVKLQNVLPWLDGGRKLSGLLPVSSKDMRASSDGKTDPLYLILLTKKGQLKKTPLAVFSDLTARGLIAIILQENGDSVGWARLCTAKDSVLIATAQGNVLRLSCDEASLRSQGRRTLGLKAINLNPGASSESCMLEISDHIVSMDVASDDPADPHTHALFLTARGNGKRVALSEIRSQKRGGKGVLATKFKKTKSPPSSSSTKKKMASKDPDHLVGVCCSRDTDECMIVTREGMVVRQALSGIPEQSRASTGVSVQNVDESSSGGPSDVVMDVCLVPADLVADDDDQPAAALLVDEGLPVAA